MTVPIINTLGNKKYVLVRGDGSCKGCCFAPKKRQLCANSKSAITAPMSCLFPDNNIFKEEKQ